MLCVISSKKYGILSKRAIRGRGGGRGKLGRIRPAWLVERLIRVHVYRLNRETKGSFVVLKGR